MGNDIVALGELLIDMTPHGKSEKGNALLEVNPGGAPCNLLAMAARLGSETAFIGKVGGDAFGRLLKEAVEAQGVDCSALCLDTRYPTTMAFVHLDEEGDRDFSFCRGADEKLEPGDVPAGLIEGARVFHFGTISLTGDPSATATAHALACAKRAGGLVSFDPNLRPALWPSEAAMMAAMRWGLGQCDILKISEEELAALTGTGDIEVGVAALQAGYPQIGLVLLTLGGEGSMAIWPGGRLRVGAAPVAKVVDTTGAGDCFFGAVLHHVARTGIEQIDPEALCEAVLAASVAASLVIGRKGSLREMPTAAAVAARLDEVRAKIRVEA